MKNIEDTLDHYLDMYGVPKYCFDHDSAFDAIYSAMSDYRNIWIKFNWEERATHPPKPGRYLIYRKKCNKMHFEQWNGLGWASSNKDCTHWADLKAPID